MSFWEVAASLLEGAGLFSISIVFFRVLLLYIVLWIITWLVRLLVLPFQYIYHSRELFYFACWDLTEFQVQ